jgi:hypothetical protein
VPAPSTPLTSTPSGSATYSFLTRSEELNETHPLQILNILDDHSRVCIASVGRRITIGTQVWASFARRTRDHQVLGQAALTLEPAGDRAMDGDILDWCRDALTMASPQVPRAVLSRPDRCSATT